MKMLHTVRAFALTVKKFPCQLFRAEDRLLHVRLARIQVSGGPGRAHEMLPGKYSP